METHTDPQRPVRSSKRRAKTAIGAATLMAVVVGLVVWATTRPGATSFYMTTSELVAAGPAETTKDFRVNGSVLPGSIETTGLVTSFTITDGRTELSVTTDRPLPDTFRERSDVVARGRMEGTTFVADEVLAKCPSKFKARA